MDNLNIILFNDDNHAERIYANGKFIGTLADMEDVFRNFVNVINFGQTKYNDIRCTTIWTCDDFDDFDEDSDIVDNIWDWFNTVDTMTTEQIDCVFNKDWEKLNNII